MFSVKEILENYLKEGKILILVDSTQENVDLPDYVMNSIQVKLNLSYNFKNVTVFTMDEEKVTIDLSFKGVKYLCKIPYTSIYYVAMANHPIDGIEILENTPIEILQFKFVLYEYENKKQEQAKKEIDFLSYLPKGKQKKNTVSEKHSDKMLEEIFNMMKDPDVLEAYNNIQSKLYTAPQLENEIILNKDDFKKK